jgi:predicted nucleic-acid-binding protein
VLAVDTNVIVRYLTRDDAEQFARTIAIIGRVDVYICTTVLLEAEWVLRRSYGFSRDRVVQALAAVAALPRVTLEDGALLATALDWAARGMDFADALHLAKSAHCDAFISFDRRLANAAAAVPAVVVRVP